MNFRAWPDWSPSRQVRSNRFDRPDEVDRHEEPGPDGAAACPRPTSRDCPACWLDVTYAGIVFDLQRPGDPRTGRSAGPLWPVVLYGVASTIGMWGGVNGVEQIWK